MTECANIEMRDRLPDVVHGRLDAALLVEVQTHVTSCVACQAEIQLLEGARRVFILATPRVNTAAIVASLPGSPVARRRAFDWRIAASILVLAIGGGSAALAYANRGATPQLSDTIALVSPTTEAGNDLSITGDLSALTDDQLRALVGRVESIESLPAEEVKASSQLNGVLPTSTSATNSRDSSGGL